MRRRRVVDNGVAECFPARVDWGCGIDLEDIGEEDIDGFADLGDLPGLDIGSAGQGLKVPGDVFGGSVLNRSTGFGCCKGLCPSDAERDAVVGNLPGRKGLFELDPEGICRLVDCKPLIYSVLVGNALVERLTV